MKYPTILSNPCGTQTVIAYDSSNVYHLEGLFEGKYVKDYHIHDTRNVTREFLDSTYGVVESKEHAEFIIELAKVNGIEVIKWPSDQKVFVFRETYGELTLNMVDSSYVEKGLKNITIPMPPKNTINKEFKVDDEVVYCGRSKMTIKAICGDFAWCECTTSSLRMLTVHLDNIKPYKATLREKVWDVVANTELKDSVIDSIVTDLLEEFDIKAKLDEEI